ncbi:MAG: UbiA family prenyltransferase [Synechococcaceae cyanobacterium]|nr:UbiA family prenyltransferase [Synechococcaceae cyanobacterium]
MTRPHPPPSQASPRTDPPPLRRPSLPQRLWRYQAERFPLRRHGPLILVFSGAAAGYGLRLGQGVPRPVPLLAAVLVVLLQFLLLRLADEFKDADDDRRWRPGRPVPRGLVSLQELAGLGLLAAAGQLLLVLALRPGALAALLAVWGWFLLMCAEFFRPRWLRRRLALYALSHLPIVPLLALLAMALQGPLPQPPAALLPFLLCTYLAALLLELSRKTRLPADEEPGVDTYSAHWGWRTCLRLWLTALPAIALTALAAAAAIDQGPLLLALLLPLALVSPALVLPWLWPPPPPASAAERLEALTALWILALYLGLGWLPWLPALAGAGAAVGQP